MLLLCSLEFRVGGGSDPRVLLTFCSVIGNACMMSIVIVDANAQLTLPPDA